MSEHTRIENSTEKRAQLQKISYSESVKHSCRVCLLRSTVDMDFIFSIDEQVISLAEQINQCSEIPLITQNDGFAQYICGACKGMLEVAQRFRELCKKSDEEMRIMHLRNEIKTETEADCLLGETDKNAIKIETIYTNIVEDPKLSKQLPMHIYSPILTEVVTSGDHKDIPKHTLQCEHCGKVLKTAKTLKRHKQLHDLPSTSSSDKSYPCLQCNQSYHDERNLHRHVKIHTTDRAPSKNLTARTHRCEHCGKILKSAKTLKHHIQTHDSPSASDKSYPCLQCDKSFHQERNLHRHIKRHLVDRPFVCEICGKTFKYKDQIKIHLDNHQNIRNFACSQCPYRSGTRANLEIHERSHTGQRPFECPVCLQKFTTSSNRMKHVRTIHEKRKNHACEVCGRLFSDSIGVRQHMAVHSAIKRYECRHCANVYGHLSGLKKHMKKLHPGLKTPSFASFFVNDRPTFKT